MQFHCECFSISKSMYSLRSHNLLVHAHYTAMCVIAEHCTALLHAKRHLLKPYPPPFAWKQLCYFQAASNHFCSLDKPDGTDFSIVLCYAGLAALASLPQATG